MPWKVQPHKLSFILRRKLKGSPTVGQYWSTWMLKDLNTPSPVLETALRKGETATWAFQGHHCRKGTIMVNETLEDSVKHNNS